MEGLTTPASQTAQIPNSRCVLWIHPGDVVPKPLLRSLERRIEKTIFVHDPFQALAEVCALTHEGRSAGRPYAIVLLLNKPAKLPDATQVLHNLDLYAPRTRRWRFDPSANPIFAPLTEQDVARLAQARSPEIVVRRNGGRPGPGDTGAPIFPSLPRKARSTNVSPRLRLTEDFDLHSSRADPSADTVVGVPEAGGGGGSKRTPPPDLTPEELQMLLSDRPTQPPPPSVS